jgi:lysophospholipase L1-like esterase
MKKTSLVLCLLLTACGSDPPPTVVFMGDSITAAWPISDYMQGAVNVGINGQTSAQMLARFQTDVLVRNPATVVILAGTNDILHTQNPTVDSIQKMADMAAHAGIRVIIGEVPPNSTWTDVITDPVQGNATIETFNAQIVMMANASGYPVADYYDALILPDGTQNSALFLDGTHPNRAGYHAMWPEVQTRL